MEEKKEEWKELLEKATLEDSPEKNFPNETNEVIKTAEVIAAPAEENSSHVVLADESQDLEEIDQEMIDKKTKSEFRSRLVMVFVLGFLIGIAVKTEALRKITIGYDDYLMKIKSQSYDINQMQLTLTKTRESATQSQESEGASPLEGISVIDGGEGDNQTTENNQAQN